MTRKPKPLAWGWALKALRTRPEVDLDQLTLASESGISYYRITRIESGTLSVDDAALAKLAKVLKVKPEFFRSLAERGEPIVEVKP